MGAYILTGFKLDQNCSWHFLSSLKHPLPNKMDLLLTQKIKSPFSEISMLDFSVHLGIYIHDFEKHVHSISFSLHYASLIEMLRV